MEIMKFKNLKQKKIAWCLVDNLTICQSNLAKEVMSNLSDQFIFKCSSAGYDIFIGSQEDLLLAEVSSEPFYSHAVMLSTGTSLKLNEKLFGAIESLCSKDFFIAGHILDRKENYYELHHQFYVVNLLEYNELGKPAIGNEDNVPHVKLKPIRSEENVHDDYVPLWIRLGSEFTEYQKKMHGWNILSTGLDHHKTIIDLGLDVRNSKKYLYYEYDHVFIKEFSEIHYNMFLGSNFVPGWNTDQLNHDIQFSGPVEQYITTGTGFNWIKNLQLLGYNQDTEIVFTDVNPNCLRFMKLLVTEWDGNNYAEFYKKFIQGIVPNGPTKLPENYFELVDNKWKEVVGTLTDWPTQWRKIQNLKFKFININYTAQYDLSWIIPHKKTLMNLSDLFCWTPFISISSLKYRIACENRLITTLNSIDPNIVLMLTARAADQFRKVESQQYYGQVDQFDLTDINELIRPPWHQEDWTSYRILG